jgi:hypothetical protein
MDIWHSCDTSNDRFSNNRRDLIIKAKLVLKHKHWQMTKKNKNFTDHLMNIGRFDSATRLSRKRTTKRIVAYNTTLSTGHFTNKVTLQQKILQLSKQKIPIDQIIIN